MSLNSYLEPAKSSNPILFIQSFLLHNFRMQMGWKTWVKYRDHFAQSSFVLRAEKSPWIENGILILLLNKKKIDEVIDANRDLFLETLRIEEVVQQHEGLLGILLGYGRNNSMLFWKRSLGEEISLTTPWDKEIDEQMFQHRSLFHWWKMLFAKDEEKLKLSLEYPYFACDPSSEETKRLKTEYLQTREQILESYREKDFLEATLELLSR